MNKLEKTKALHQEVIGLTDQISVKTAEIRKLNAEIYSDLTGIEVEDVVSYKEKEYMVGKIIGSSAYQGTSTPRWLAKVFVHKKTKTGWHKNETQLWDVPTLVSKGGAK